MREIFSIRARDMVVVIDRAILMEHKLYGNVWVDNDRIGAVDTLLSHYVLNSDMCICCLGSEWE